MNVINELDDLLDANPEERVAVIIPSWEDGAILFEDHKVKDLKKQLVTECELFGKPPAGYQRYTSVRLMDSSGCLGTFTSASWGGHYAVKDRIPQYKLQRKRAFSVCALRTKARNDQYGNIDPVFQIVGWAARSKFDAILGPEEVETKALAAPESVPLPAPEPVTSAPEQVVSAPESETSKPKVKTPASKKRTSEIIDDDLPW